MLLTLLERQNRSALQWVNFMQEEDEWLDGIALMTFRHMLKVHVIHTILRQASFTVNDYRFT
jgi:hypothetical protein